jgi:hypothetical protein
MEQRSLTGREKEGAKELEVSVALWAFLIA